MFIHSYSILAYAQTFSMNFPDGGSGIDEGVSIDQAGGAETRTFKFFNTLYDPNAEGTLAEPFDGTTIRITNFPFPVPLPGDLNYCQETFGKGHVNTIGYTYNHAICDFVFGTPNILYILLDPPYNNWFITYEAPDAFSFQDHLSEFTNSLDTLQLLR